LDTLATKLEKLKDEHAQETLETLHDDHAQATQQQAIFVLGRIKQNDHIGNAIAENLSAQTILALQRFQQEKLHEHLGYDTFDQFLNESKYSPMTKHQYYERLALVNKHGTDVADLLTSVGISMRTQKLLEKGDVEIKDDRVYIAGRELAVANSGEVKDLIVEFCDENRRLRSDKEKALRDNEKLKRENQQGRVELEKKQREIDAILQDDPLAAAVGIAFSILNDLIAAVAERTSEIASLK
jgi:hypothetical protein